MGEAAAAAAARRSLADEIIQHELLMSWIIARFHGYGSHRTWPAQCGDGRGGGGEIKTVGNMGKLCTAGSSMDALRQNSNINNCTEVLL